MKFDNYIKFDKQIENIINNCKPFLNLLKKEGIYSPLYRGLNSVDFIGKKKVRKNRQPQGTNPKAFKIINKKLKEMGHIPRNNAVISTFNINTTKIFGSAYYIFPIDKVDFSYCKEDDFNLIGYDNDDDIEEEYNFYNWLRTFDIPDNLYKDGEWIETTPKEWDTYINNILKKYIVTNKKLGSAWRGQYEIWWNCKEYYYISYKLISEKDLMEKIL